MRGIHNNVQQDSCVQQGQKVTSHNSQHLRENSWNHHGEANVMASLHCRICDVPIYGWTCICITVLLTSTTISTGPTVLPWLGSSQGWGSNGINYNLSNGLGADVTICGKLVDTLSNSLTYLLPPATKQNKKINKQRGMETAKTNQWKNKRNQNGSVRKGWKVWSADGATKTFCKEIYWTSG